MWRHVHELDPDSYNPALPVAENLLFAVPREPITPDLLMRQTEFLAQLRNLKLDNVLVELTRDVIDTLRRIFGLDGTDHPLFRTLGLDPGIYETAVELVEKSRGSLTPEWNDRELGNLLAVPFVISAEQIGPAFSDEIKERILELRKSHSRSLLDSLDGLFVPFDSHRLAPGLTVLENAIFGLISQDAGSKGDDLRKLVAMALIDSGVQEEVVQLIYDLPIPLGGANVSPAFAEPLAFSRATIKRPDILILEQALASYGLETRIAVHKSLRRLLPDTTLIYLGGSFEDEDVFDAYFELQKGRIVSEDMVDEQGEDSAASADLERKLRALEGTALFSNLNRKQLRLLAFGARWYEAKKGEVVFLKNDPPEDGAYLVLEGEAGLYLPKSGEPDQLIVTAKPGTLVGELGLIRNEPRALSMVADTDIRCLRIGAAEFLAVVENDAATAFKLLQVVAGYVSK